MKEIPVKANCCEREELHATGRELCHAWAGGRVDVIRVTSFYSGNERLDKGINYSSGRVLNQPEISKKRIGQM